VLALLERISEVNRERMVNTKTKIKPQSKILLIMFFSTLLSLFASESLFISHRYGIGPQTYPTELEVQALTFLDQISVKCYVVIAPPVTAEIGWSLFGTRDPCRRFEPYIYSYDPSIESMKILMENKRSNLSYVEGYFIAVSFRSPDFRQVVEKASEIFEQIHIFQSEYGEVRLFRCRCS
jgi:hypothetical protein